MCKIVELGIGENSFDRETMKSFINTGVILKSDLQKCLMENDAVTTENFNHLLGILESYCLIYRLSSVHCHLLDLRNGNDDDKYLVPCKMPQLKKEIIFPKVCYKFEFDFQSYLPEEVYIHTICQLMSEIDDSAFDDKWSIELTNTCTVFKCIKFKDLPSADWKIEMDTKRHVLVFSVW